ncbi:MAG: hypothetical protein KGH88_01550 [Thaumarchaeota archaeon]|nr:hypothetical protein [Nitrososphaerota archaeon]
MKKKYILLMVYFGFFVGLVTYEILHPPFSSDSARVGNYEVQVTTTPSVPDVGKDTKIHFLVLGQDDRQVDSVRVGIKIYHDDDLMKEFQPASYPGAFDVDYVFQEPGNHVFQVDLFDLGTGSASSYQFNITTLSLYTSIFVALVIAGVAGASGIIIAILIFTKRTRPSFRY